MNAHLPSFSSDLAIIGGGLAGGLIAMAVAARHPGSRIMLVEQGPVLGGNHLWSFFDGDLDPEAAALVAPIIAQRWPAGHAVRFPGFERSLDTPYNSIASASLDAHLRTLANVTIFTEATVTALTPESATLHDGSRIAAKAVIDARGGGDLSVLDCGWQKFVGQRLRLSAPHGLDRPVIMDATVAQLDGYRFVYLLPFGPNEIFVEDTYYSDDETLDVPAIRARIADYARAQGWHVEAVAHEEQGVIPVVHGGAFDRFWPGSQGVARAGTRAGLFHPLTGYSLPDAAATALALAARYPIDGAALARWSRTRAAAHWRRGGYYRLLGRMLFRAAPPAERWRVFARFYRLAPALVGRFYAGRSTIFDKARILCGRPPVPIRAAMHALMNRNSR
ncbi:lycopene beta-cyclase CrtY [Sphingobium sp. H39-3-25]|uniref:lycopene beta-cyclase CrtY n=1 Tax=Sphingobium arseniciresistens TaxID=3030834 RepID=UPI0023B9AA3B|nr:lycopene beta-cyclase CrtY [Sphingobium arseniciresistens]